MTKPKKTKPEIDPRENHIEMFMHCGKCIRELPKGVSPRQWASLEVGWTKPGLQVWCKRHECNVLHVDFEKVKHPACLAALDIPPAPGKAEIH